MNTVYLPFKRLTYYKKPICCVSKDKRCKAYSMLVPTSQAYCSQVGKVINNAQPHANCPVWSKDAITLQAAPVVACEEA